MIDLIQMKTVIHGVPVMFHDEEDQERVNGWIDYLTTSAAVKQVSPKIEKMEVMTLNDLYWRQAAVKFHCRERDEITSGERCEGGLCGNWDSGDNKCIVMDETYTFIEKQPITKEISLDTMHIIQLTLKEKNQ